jgi:hypothetical protein
VRTSVDDQSREGDWEVRGPGRNVRLEGENAGGAARARVPPHSGACRPTSGLNARPHLSGLTYIPPGAHGRQAHVSGMFEGLKEAGRLADGLRNEGPVGRGRAWAGHCAQLIADHGDAGARAQRARGASVREVVGKGQGQGP